MNTIFVGLHSFEYYPDKYYNDLVCTISHCKSFSQTDKFVTLNLTGVELLAKSTSLNIVVLLPLKLDTRESLTDYLFQQCVIDTLGLIKKYNNIFILTGSTWDDVYGKVDNSDIIDQLTFWFRLNNVPLSKLFYFYQNVEYHKLWLIKTQNLEKAKKPNLFYNPVYLSRFGSLDKKFEVEIGFKNKTKHFLMLNRRHAAVRLALATYLNFKYKDKTYLSYNCSNSDSTQNTIHQVTDKHITQLILDFPFITDRISKDVLKDFVNLLPITLDNPTKESLPIALQDTLPVDLIYNSACYVVNETHFDGLNQLGFQLEPNKNYDFKYTDGFHTEKSLKSFLWGMPTIWAANYNTLQTFKYLGFKTYDGLIDERYDRIENFNDRLYAIMDEIDRIASIKDINGWYKEGMSVYEHNNKLLKSLIERDTIELINEQCNRQRV